MRRVNVARILAVAAVAVLGAVAILYDEPALPRDLTVVVGAQPAEVAVDAPSGHVFVVNDDDGTLRMFDAATLGLRAVRDLGQSPGPLLIDERSERAFVVTDGNSGVTVVDTRTGRVLRTVPLNTAERPALALDRPTGHVFLTGEAGIVMLDGRDGRILHVEALNADLGGPSSLAIDERAGRLYAVDHSGDAVLVLDTRSGRLIHTVAVGNGPTAVAVDARTARAFVVNAAAYTLSVLDTQADRVLRTEQLDPGPLAVDEATGHVFVAAYGAACTLLHVLDAVSGRPLRTVCSGPIGGSPTALVVDARRGRVVVIADGGVAVYDAHDGALLRAPALDLAAAVGAAIDEAGGRAFVIGQQAVTGPRPRAAGGIFDIGAWPLWQRLPWLPHPAPPPLVPAGTGIISAVGL